jgi:lipopolysaccharide/colanic/teichoic acid biosynthesis glycosyltransferase
VVFVFGLQNFNEDYPCCFKRVWCGMMFLALNLEPCALNLVFSHWMKFDMEYIDGWPLWLDFKILALTIPAALKGSGAA